MRVGARVTIVSLEAATTLNVFRNSRRANRAHATLGQNALRRGHSCCPRIMPMVDITQYLSDCKLILVSNREPYEHTCGANGVEVKQPAGGLVSSLDPTMRRTQGTWVAWGSGDADRQAADETGRVLVP